MALRWWLKKGSDLHCSKDKVQSIRSPRCPESVTEQFPPFLPMCKCSWTCACGHLARDYHVLGPFVGVANGVWTEVLCVTPDLGFLKKMYKQLPSYIPFLWTGTGKCLWPTFDPSNKGADLCQKQERRRLGPWMVMWYRECSYSSWTMRGIIFLSPLVFWVSCYSNLDFHVTNIKTKGPCERLRQCLQFIEVQIVPKSLQTLAHSRCFINSY